MTKIKTRHLLNTSTGTEAHVRVDMTLHLPVVVAVCLREHKQKEQWVLKIQNRTWDQCETKHVFRFKHSAAPVPDDNSEIGAR